MEIVAATLLFSAFLLGVFPFTQLVSGHPTRQNLVKGHLILFLLGIIALVIYAFTTPADHKHLDSLALLATALLIGSIAYARRDHRTWPSWLLAYTVTGGFAVLWVLTYVIPNS